MEPDALSYDSTIEVCARGGRTDLALQGLADMRAAGLGPSKPSWDAAVCADRTKWGQTFLTLTKTASKPQTLGSNLWRSL